MTWLLQLRLPTSSCVKYTIWIKSENTHVITSLSPFFPPCYIHAARRACLRLNAFSKMLLLKNSNYLVRAFCLFPYHKLLWACWNKSAFKSMLAITMEIKGVQMKCYTGFLSPNAVQRFSLSFPVKRCNLWHWV